MKSEFETISTHFRNFQGFKPEIGMRFLCATDKNPRDAAIEILRLNKGKKVDITYYPIIDKGTDRAIKEVKLEGVTVPENDEEINSIIKQVNTNTVALNIFGRGGYDFQRIYIGDQSITEVDTNIDEE